ncbi:MAG TPA: hypothetical protein VMD56_03015, partial [Steroidobacteraceae bacterium]|nr:hypothetical protein [Steroidobacteraceae bacterium]
RVELIDAIGLAAFRGLLNEKIFHDALAALDEDFEEGRYLQADLNGRSRAPLGHFWDRCRTG